MGSCPLVQAISLPITAFESAGLSKRRRRHAWGLGYAEQVAGRRVDNPQEPLAAILGGRPPISGLGAPSRPTTKRRHIARQRSAQRCGRSSSSAARSARGGTRNPSPIAHGLKRPGRCSGGVGVQIGGATSTYSAADGAARRRRIVTARHPRPAVVGLSSVQLLPKVLQESRLTLVSLLEPPLEKPGILSDSTPAQHLPNPSWRTKNPVGRNPRAGSSPASASGLAVAGTAAGSTGHMNAKALLANAGMSRNNNSLGTTPMRSYPYRASAFSSPVTGGKKRASMWRLPRSV